MEGNVPQSARAEGKAKSDEILGKPAMPEIVQV